MSGYWGNLGVTIPINCHEKKILGQSDTWTCAIMIPSPANKRLTTRGVTEYNKIHSVWIFCHTVYESMILIYSSVRVRTAFVWNVCVCITRVFLFWVPLIKIYFRCGKIAKKNTIKTMREKMNGRKSFSHVVLIIANIFSRD